MRFGGSITHFDFYLAAGGRRRRLGRCRATCRQRRLRAEVLSGRAFAFRIDVRDHLFRQQLLSQKMWVNDLSATLGLSLYLPVRE